jgi:hypothetical protein
MKYSPLKHEQNMGLILMCSSLQKLTMNFCWWTGKLLAFMLRMLFPEKQSISSQFEFQATLLAFGS